MTSVLLLCGSFHRGSMNREALDCAARAVRARGADVIESIPLDALPALDPRLFAALPDSVATLRAELAGSDAVVLACPEYAGGMAGSLKNALDWCVGAADGFYGRPVALLSAGTTGGEHALHQMARTLLWQGAHPLAALGIVAPRTKCDAAGRLVEPETLAVIDDCASALLAGVPQPVDSRIERVRAVASQLGIEAWPHMP